MNGTRKTLSELGIKPSGRLSQNFLIDGGIISMEISMASIGADDVVLDIGAGLGFLTEAISKKARKVIAVELDKRLFSYLKSRFEKNKNIEIVNGDILGIIEKIEFDKVVANVPYAISSPLTFALLSKKRMRSAVICYQKEFAERMIAKPGEREYSRLSVMVNYLADVELLAVVGKSSFFPQPKVDSAIVMMTPRKEKPYRVADEAAFFSTVKLLFQHRKQTVRNALLHSAKHLGLQKGMIKSVGLKSDLASRRVFTLTGEELSKISDEVREFAKSG